MTPNTNKPDEILIEHREQSAEEFTKKHFPGLEKETWFPVIVAIAEGYAKLFKYDFSKSCECVYSPGETWCCNLCGYPVDNSSPNSQVTKLQSQLHAKSEECERLRKRVAELEHIIDHEINDDEDNFQHCADCDLPDACSDYGCAIENGIKRKNDGVF